MRFISQEQITDLVAELALKANFDLPEDVFHALERALDVETSSRGRWVLELLLENARVAAEQRLPLCQDTGLVVAWVQIGRQAQVAGDLQEALDEGVRLAYTQAPLRKSVLADPLDRASNTGDNTPVLAHVELVSGDRVTIELMPKGGGSENASAAWMLAPGEGEEGLVERVVAQVRAQGGKWCPPGIVGVGVGGTLDGAAALAKRALLRPCGQHHAQERWAALESRLLDAINATGIGPMGLGGDVTALAVHLEYAPCHIASLPVAVNFQCHAARRARGVI